MVSRVRTGPDASITCWLTYQAKVAGGLELAEQDRLNGEPALMNSEVLGGLMATSSGPSVKRQHRGSVQVQHRCNPTVTAVSHHF